MLFLNEKNLVPSALLFAHSPIDEAKQPFFPSPADVAFIGRLSATNAASADDGNVQGTTLRLNHVVGNKSAPSRFGAQLPFANSQEQGVLFIAQTRPMYYNKHRTRFFPPKRGFIRLA
ncbi:hypothetical protein [Geobacillus sp. YF-1]|uniref:hypothetical protein n=1 Tax=Geobacillus sp. YF-1 TaxID=3457480 RepID=UPI004045F530